MKVSLARRFSREQGNSSSTPGARYRIWPLQYGGSRQLTQRTSIPRRHAIKRFEFSMVGDARSTQRAQFDQADEAARGQKAAASSATHAADKIAVAATKAGAR